MMEKNGMLTEDSRSDFDLTKKAKYYDAKGTSVADEANKNKLKQPVPIGKYPMSHKTDLIKGV